MLIRILLLALLLTACSPYKTLVVKDNLAATYAAAVQDASQPQPDEVASTLWSLSTDNPELIRDGEGRVLVVTWTDWDGYQKAVGTDMTLSRDIWITPAPQLQDFCQNLRLDSTKMQLRLKQLLGLPPEGNKAFFAEMWVDPSACFRPCPDPEVTDSECSIAYPVSHYGTVPDTHKKWIENLRKESYGPQGYPWTQLGYTYDWGNPKDHVGLSEYIIPEGTTVRIKAAEGIYNYCGAK
jgi:hypothetical protein